MSKAKAHVGHSKKIREANPPIGTNDEWALSTAPFIRMAYLVGTGDDAQIVGLIEEFGADGTDEHCADLLDTAKTLHAAAGLCEAAVRRIGEVAEARGL